MTIAASASIKVPIQSKKTLIMRRIRILLLVRPRMNSAIIVGTCSMVMMLPKIVAIAINTMTIAEVLQASITQPVMLLRLISLYTKQPTSSPYSADTAAASVGVMMPP